MNEKDKQTINPTSQELRAELKRAEQTSKYRKTLKSTVFSLITVAAVAVLIATIFLPVFQIYGTSMTPTLRDGDVVVSVKHTELQQQDVIAFYYNNKILVKRVIANSGEWVDIDDNGNVYVNSVKLDEPYVQNKTIGEYDIKFPYQVPEGKVFVLGDHREVSVDSRNKSVGCVATEQIVGKLVLRIWPVDSIGKINHR